MFSSIASSICSPACTTQRLAPLFRSTLAQTLGDDRFEVKVFHKISDIPYSLWQTTAHQKNALLELPFLSAIEQCPPSDCQPIYLVFYQQQTPVGLAYCQLIEFNASESISREPLNGDECLFASLGKFFKEFVSKNVHFYSFVCGNLLATGENTSAFAQHINAATQVKMLNEGVEAARKLLQKELNIDIKMTLFKEFYESSKPSIDAFITDGGCHEFIVQPNMLMNIDANWRTFDDYLAAIGSKYRVRVRRGFKKMAELECRSLELADLVTHQTTMHQLYKAITNQAEFNLIKLTEGYFVALKRELKSDFLVKGYFNAQQEMVGFCTMIKSHDSLDAHFLGLDSSYNASHQLYFNMLLEILKTGIDWRVAHIIYARTALEIKSSVGAVPYQMFNYVRHRNTVSNTLIHRLFTFLQPKPLVWQQRHPFKDSE